MSRFIEQLKKIENLDAVKLAETLEFNGYPECTHSIRTRNINGRAFLKLTEVQISLWRLPIVHSRRIWSFVQQINQDPTQLLLKHEPNNKPPISTNKPTAMSKPVLKSESFLHKSRLVQQTLNLDAVDVPGTPSIDHAARIPPRRFPKPPHLIATSDYSKNGSNLIDTDDENDGGYLSPVTNATQSVFNFNTISPGTSHSSTNTSSFLNKFRQSFEHLENRRISIENPYDQRKPFINKIRPPLPVPLANKNIQHEIDEEVEELPEYSDLTEDDEHLAEYTAVLEENVTISHRPLPPVPRVTNNNRISPRLRLPSSSDSDISSSSLIETRERKHSFPNLNIQTLPLRKSPINLPKPPSLLPPTIVNIPIIKTQTTTHPNSILLRPLPSLPPEPSTFDNKDVHANIQKEEEPNEDYDDEELTDYSEVDLENDPYYRDTDRKGARILLNGLEDGAFLIRPSKQQNYICSFSIMHHLKLFNLGVEKHDDGTVGFEGVTSQFNQPNFYNVDDMVVYYSVNPLYISGQILYLKKILPTNRR